MSAIHETSNQEFSNIYLSSDSYSDVCRKHNVCVSTTHIGQVKKRADLLGLVDDHMTRGLCQTKYSLINKDCPVCAKPFSARSGHPREKMTCSHSCSNTLFRSGVNNGMYRSGKHVSAYRNKALTELPNRCNRCGYSKYIEVLQAHHKDRDRNNNDISNLELLCPTCYEEEHFVNKDGRWSSKNK